MILEAIAGFFHRLAFPGGKPHDGLDPLMQRVAKSAGLELPETCNGHQLDDQIERVSVSTNTPIPGAVPALP